MPDGHTRPSKKFGDLVHQAITCLGGVGTGVLFGLAFPPFGWSWLVWVSLVPLLLAIRSSRDGRRAATIAGGAGLVAFLIAAYPLTSASVWSGWMSVTSEGLSQLQTRQWWFLHGLWVLICLVIAASWAAFGAVVRWLQPGAVAAFVVIPAAWVVLTEWVRSSVLWGFQWSFLGNAVASFDSIRQTAALGGVWLLSAVVVATNVGIAESIAQAIARKHRALLPLLCAGGLLIAAFVYGSLRLRQPSLAGGQPVRAVALQGQRTSYVASDFLDFGLDRDYHAMLNEAVRGDVDLVVLPESVSHWPISVDGSLVPGRNPDAHRSIESWNAVIGSLLFETPKIVIVGADVIEASEPHNSMLAWQGGQLAGWYHKARLVPFSEYQPRLWGRGAIRGKRSYAAGNSNQVIEADGLNLGVFICQEVQFPQLVRDIVRSGAEVLVSGGNDGVFGSPAVAQVHDDMATLRATESGRYLVRAMKNGVSAVIDPFGNHVARLPVGEAGVAEGDIVPLRTLTVYGRLGAWPVWISLAILAGTRASRVRKH